MAEPAFAFTRDTPGFKVLVADRELPAETALDIIDVKVCDYVEGASVFTVRFNIWDASRQELKWIDDTLLSEGAQVEVRIGFVDHFQTLIIGEITAIEPEFHQNEAPTLVIHGYDHLHRFRRGRKTRSFINAKDSEIAEQIARNLQLRAKVEDTTGHPRIPAAKQPNRHRLSAGTGPAHSLRSARPGQDPVLPQSRQCHG